MQNSVDSPGRALTCSYTFFVPLLLTLILTFGPPKHQKCTKWNFINCGCRPKWPPKNCPPGIWSKYRKLNFLNEVGHVIHQHLYFEGRNSFLMYLANFSTIEAQ